MDYLEYLEYDLTARIYTGDKLRDYGDGKWITVGKRDENKNLEGKGTHIFVKGKGLNARIVKGPAGIAGKRMKHLLYNHIKNVQGNKSPNKNPNSFKPDNADLSKADFYQSQSAGTKISSRNNKDRSYYKKNENGKWDKYKWDSQNKKFVKAGVNLSDETMAGKGINNKGYNFTKGEEQNKPKEHNETNANSKYNNIQINEGDLSKSLFYSNLDNGTVITGSNGTTYEKKYGFWVERDKNGKLIPYTIMSNADISKLGLNNSTVVQTLKEQPETMPILPSKKKMDGFNKISPTETDLNSTDYFENLAEGSLIVNKYGDSYIKKGGDWCLLSSDGKLRGTKYPSAFISGSREFDRNTAFLVPKKSLKPKKNGKPDGKMSNGSYHPLLKELATKNIAYNKVEKLETPLSENEIINKLCGGDETSGSCASLATAYIANKLGYNVTDFRGYASCDFFSDRKHLRELYTDYSTNPPTPLYKTFEDEKGVLGPYTRDNTAIKKALRSMEEGKEYNLLWCRHSAIIRKVNGKLQYLDLQCGKDRRYEHDIHNGWNDADEALLGWRFGAPCLSMRADLIPLEKCNKCTNFNESLGYINTATGKQHKGESGTIK